MIERVKFCVEEARIGNVHRTLDKLWLPKPNTRAPFPRTRLTAPSNPRDVYRSSSRPPLPSFSPACSVSVLCFPDGLYCPRRGTESVYVAGSILRSNTLQRRSLFRHSRRRSPSRRRSQSIIRNSLQAIWAMKNLFSSTNR